MVFDYDEDEYEPTQLSVHGMTQRVSTLGQSSSPAKKAAPKKTGQVLPAKAGGTTTIQNQIMMGSGLPGSQLELLSDRFENINLDSGETMELINHEGAGIIHSIEVVLDNPYLAVSMQIDGYRNAETTGETPAELLLNNRTTRVSGSFWVKSVASDGTYTMLYTPQTPEPYSESFKMTIANRIMPSSDVYGFSLNYTSRGGIPTPMKTDFMGGGQYQHTGLKAVDLETMSNAIAKPVGSSPYSVDDVYNVSVYVTGTTKIGSEHPYQGQAGKPTFTKSTGFDGAIATVEFKAAGTAGADANAVAHPALANTNEFPGNPSAPSHQNVIIYKDASKDSTEQAGFALNEATSPAVQVDGAISADAGVTITVDNEDPRDQYAVGDRCLDDDGQLVGVIASMTATTIVLTANNLVALSNNETLHKDVPSAPTIGERIFVRNGDTVYFPGIVQKIFQYNRSGDSGGDGWIERDAANFGVSTGALCFQVSPGLRTVPSVFTKTATDSSDTQSFGVVTTAADSNPKALVKSTVIKRQRVS
tara:strand:- start:812 stop:2407 length:1596 start_codon:yes stop_codon:yes gene_type:complete